MVVMVVLVVVLLVSAAVKLGVVGHVGMVSTQVLTGVQGGPTDPANAGGDAIVGESKGGLGELVEKRCMNRPRTFHSQVSALALYSPRNQWHS